MHSQGYRARYESSLAPKAVDDYIAIAKKHGLTATQVFFAIFVDTSFSQLLTFSSVFHVTHTSTYESFSKTLFSFVIHVAHTSTPLAISNSNSNFVQF